MSKKIKLLPLAMSVLFCFYSFVLRFQHVILITSTSYFRLVAKFLVSLLSGDYNVSWLKVFNKLVRSNKFQAT